jgi:hypothetical protein
MSADITKFWVEAHPASLRCLACGRSFDNEALVRTFRLVDLGSADTVDVAASCSRVVETSRAGF